MSLPPLPINTNTQRRRIAERIQQHRLALGYAPDASRAHYTAATEALRFLHRKQGITDLHDVTPANLRAYYQHTASRIGQRPNRDDQPLTRESLRRILRRTAALFELLHTDGLLSTDPASAINIDQLLPEAQATDRAIPSEKDIAKLYDATHQLPPKLYPDRARALLALLYGCALRAAEMTACTTADIRLAEQLLIIPEGKGGKRRTVPLSSGVTRHLERYLFAGDRRSLLARATKRNLAYPTTAVMLNSHGRPMRVYTANKLLTTLASIAEIDQHITCHVLRHALATHLLKRGVTTEHLRRLLGHANLDTTKHYLHLDQQQHHSLDPLAMTLMHKHSEHD